MFRWTVFTAALLAGWPATAQTREFTRTVELDAGGTLRVEGNKGSMRITSWDRSEVDIRARIEAPDDAPSDYAQQAVDAATVDVTGSRSSVSVMSNYENVPALHGWGRWGDRRVPSIHYEIRAPRRLQLQIDSDRGPATIQGFEGSFDIVMDRGELDLRDVSGELRLEIDRGETSRLSGVRGSIQIEADRTNLEIDAVTLDHDSRLEIDRGDVELSVPPTQRLTVRTDITRRGDFRSDLPIEWTSSNPKRSQGRINGGGPELFVESDRANIELRRRR